MVSVTFNIAPNMAKANQETNIQASNIAKGSIHFVNLAKE
jgi:hypothetical protein